jgi:hypothetical protein
MSHSLSPPRWSRKGYRSPPSRTHIRQSICLPRWVFVSTQGQAAPLSVTPLSPAAISSQADGQESRNKTDGWRQRGPPEARQRHHQVPLASDRFPRPSREESPCCVSLSSPRDAQATTKEQLGGGRRDGEVAEECATSRVPTSTASLSGGAEPPPPPGLAPRAFEEKHLGSPRLELQLLSSLQRLAAHCKSARRQEPEGAQVGRGGRDGFRCRPRLPPEQVPLPFPLPSCSRLTLFRRKWELLEGMAGEGSAEGIHLQGGVTPSYSHLTLFRRGGAEPASRGPQLRL